MILTLPPPAHIRVEADVLPSILTEYFGDALTYDPSARVSLDVVSASQGFSDLHGATFVILARQGGLLVFFADGSHPPRLIDTYNSPSPFGCTQSSRFIHSLRLHEEGANKLVSLYESPPFPPVTWPPSAENPPALDRPPEVPGAAAAGYSPQQLIGLQLEKLPIISDFKADSRRDVAHFIASETGYSRILFGVPPANCARWLYDVCTLTFMRLKALESQFKKLRSGPDWCVTGHKLFFGDEFGYTGASANSAFEYALEARRRSGDPFSALSGSSWYPHVLNTKFNELLMSSCSSQLLRTGVALGFDFKKEDFGRASHMYAILAAAPDDARCLVDRGRAYKLSGSRTIFHSDPGAYGSRARLLCLDFNYSSGVYFVVRAITRPSAAWLNGVFGRRRI